MPRADPRALAYGCEMQTARNVTAHAMVGDEQTFVDAGFDQYITKPLSIDALCEMLGRYMELGAPGQG